MRFIHIADLHLGSSPEAEFLWGKNRAEEIWDSFAAVIDACNEKEIDLLLIAGDLFDRPPVWADLDRAAKLFARLTATEVVMIAGASDYITEDSPWKTYPWQSWVHMLSDKHCMNVQLGNINTSVLENTGFTFKQLQKKIRMQKAVSYLLYADTPVNIIAEQLGYSCSENFMKVFKQEYGLTPTQYRARMKPQ